MFRNSVDYLIPVTFSPARARRQIAVVLARLRPGCCCVPRKAVASALCVPAFACKAQSRTCGQPQQLLADFVRCDQVALGVNRGLRVVAGTGVVDRDAAGNHRRDVARPAPREQLRLVRPVVRFEDQARPAIVCG